MVNQSLKSELRQLKGLPTGVVENKNTNLGLSLSARGSLKNIQCVEPLKCWATDDLLSIGLNALNVESQSPFIKVTRTSDKVFLSTPIEGVDETLNYEDGKLTVNLESVFPKSQALIVIKNKVYLKRPTPPILLNGGSIILDLDEYSALQVVRTGLSLKLGSTGGLQQDGETGLRLKLAGGLACDATGLRILHDESLELKSGKLSAVSGKAKFLLSFKGEQISENYSDSTFLRKPFWYSPKSYGVGETNTQVQKWGVKCTSGCIVKITVVLDVVSKLALTKQKRVGDNYRSETLLDKHFGSSPGFVSFSLVHTFAADEVCSLLWKETSASSATCNLLLEELF